MSTGNMWNNNDWGKLQYLKKNMTHCHFRMGHQLFPFTEYGITTLKTGQENKTPADISKQHSSSHLSFQKQVRNTWQISIKVKPFCWPKNE